MPSAPDPRGVPNQQRLIEDTAKIVAFVEQSTNLPSRWSGEIQISSALNARGEPAFLGRKLPGGPIEYHASIIGDVEMYYAGLEEALHSCSVVRPTEGKNLEIFNEWEEASVASCFELLKPRFRTLFSEDPLPISILPDTLSPLHYEEHMRALGVLRHMTSRERQDFYFSLLRTPLVKRRGTLISWIALAQNTTTENVVRSPAILECLSILDTEV
jgi:hypothetical protein